MTSDRQNNVKRQNNVNYVETLLRLYIGLTKNSLIYALCFTSKLHNSERRPNKKKLGVSMWSRDSIIIVYMAT